ncbi:hypothetical protein Anas_11819 [Armadillidium nasatum]|uniref:Uncharacterized protein n=1 Tax=Armadillidium nasatum TaxID=96803 RepID=A0A5N5TFS0_9CRUS|nr:hypothetical protein Anas_11819 [Armadillidium nasatum]
MKIIMKNTITMKSIIQK